MKIDDMTMVQRQLLVGKVKKMKDEGLTSKEIAERLGLSESTVRSVEKTINKAEENRQKSE